MAWYVLVNAKPYNKLKWELFCGQTIHKPLGLHSIKSKGETVQEAMQWEQNDTMLWLYSTIPLYPQIPCVRYRTILYHLVANIVEFWPLCAVPVHLCNGNLNVSVSNWERCYHHQFVYPPSKIIWPLRPKIGLPEIFLAQLSTRIIH